jgi:amidase
VGGVEIWQLGAARVAAAIRGGELSSREVVAAQLERIAAVNPIVNALRAVLAQEALAAAGEADRRLAAGDPVGPLHGVPFSVKDNVDVAGSATTWGVRALADAIAPADAPAVALLRAAGAIPLARGNMCDHALRWHTDNDLVGATLNPWDASRTPGGSSGGDAAALATGMVPLSLANDLGGSVRFPAQCTGVAALRTTPGRVPDRAPDAALSVERFNTQGPMAREVADLRLALAVLRGASPPDASGDARRVGVALPAGTDAQVAEGVWRAARALEDAGYEVEEAMPPDVEEATRLWVELLYDDLRRDWDELAPQVDEGARRFTEATFAFTPALTREGYATRWSRREAVVSAWSGYQAAFPLVLAPVCMNGSFAAGADVGAEETLLAAMRMVVAVNVVGLPAAAVPVGTGADGLPLAVQLIAPRFGETLCLDAAAAVEAAFGTVTPIDPR